MMSAPLWHPPLPVGGVRLAGMHRASFNDRPYGERGIAGAQYFGRVNKHRDGTSWSQLDVET